MTYSKFAELNQCPLQDVLALCDSERGCTHYDVGKNRYLVLFNASTAHNNVAGRIRWTLAHELGHVILNHLPYMTVPHIAENNFNNLSNPELETEADHFAALLLCPMPLYEMLGIESAQDVQRVFGLSWEASDVCWREYFKRKHSHRKTAWENDMKRLLPLLVTVLLIVLTGCASGSNSVIGTWTVDSYIINNENVSSEPAVEWIGESFAANNDTLMVFQASGHVKAKSLSIN